MTNKLSLIFKLIGLSIIAGLVVWLMLLPFALATNQLKSSTDNAFDDINLEEYSGTLSSQTTMYANDGKTVLAKFYAQNRIVVPLSQMSKNLQNAVIAREDRRFYSHRGVDLIGTLRAALSSSSGGETQGGSSITQQFVKNLLINKAMQNNDPIGIFHAREQSLFRKISEAKYAYDIETKLSKDKILEGYLNVAPFGPNVYGAEASSLHYFSKHAIDLDVAEAALIAAITKSPNAYNPIAYPKVAREQRDIVLLLMYQQKFINKDEYQKAKKTRIIDMLHTSEIRVGCKNAVYNSAFFCDWIINQIMNDPQYGPTPEKRKSYLYQSGLSITTTLDLDYQKRAAETVRKYVPADDSSQLEDALSTVEPGTGKVLAMAQNRDYDAAATGDDGSLETAINYNVGLNEGGSAGFSPGSTMKPITLTDWLRRGHSLNEGLGRLEYPIKESSFGCYSGQGLWKPRNSDGGISTAVPLVGLEHSWNMPFIQMGQKLGLCSIAQTAKDLGFVDALKGDLTDPKNMKPSMIIGAVNATPLTMANVYATMASGGIHCNTIGITKIVDASGKKVPIPAANCKRVLDENVANTMQYALRQSVLHGIAFGEAISGFDVAGKTGTSDNNNQLFAVGLIKQASTAVWVGNAEYDKEIINMSIGGTYRSVWYGMYICVPIFHDYMQAVIDDKKLTNQPLAEPDPNLTKYVGSTIQSDFGKKKDDDDSDTKKSSDTSTKNSKTTTKKKKS